MNIEKIREHYEHAKEKHPYFCDGLRPSETKSYLDTRSEKINEGMRSYSKKRICKNILKTNAKSGDVVWDEVLKAELWEIRDAINNDDRAHAVEECYDAIAVLLRVVDVLEGRQALGDPAKKEVCE